MAEQHASDVRVFVIWEPVLPSDLFAPSTASLKRIFDARVSQYWDKPRVVSRSMGEMDHDSIVWDIVLVYSPGKLWEQTPPEPSYSGGAVVDVIDETRTAIKRELEATKK
ncbi:MAG TPA: hypothetical protein VFH31_04365 [Pyrinomonadaceae bacterium]|nr:hypothetical protein [Pyrinomonadaceae bacterium]